MDNTIINPTSNFKLLLLLYIIVEFKKIKEKLVKEEKEKLVKEEKEKLVKEEKFFEKFFDIKVQNKNVISFENFKKNIPNSTILELKIKNRSSNNFDTINVKNIKYIKAIIEIYSNTDIKTILNQKKHMKILQEEKKTDKGFTYYENLLHKNKLVQLLHQKNYIQEKIGVHVSIQRADAKKILREIINIVKIKNDSMELKIKLANNEVISFIIQNQCLTLENDT